MKNWKNNAHMNWKIPKHIITKGNLQYIAYIYIDRLTKHSKD